MAVRVQTLAPAQRAEWGPAVAELESMASYPLGDDTFSIDHGADYFAFFDRLGELHYDVITDDGVVVAVLARVLRTLRLGDRERACWYLCDLKVHPEHRGRRLPQRFARHAFVRAYARCPRGYAVSMNAPKTPNRVARLARRIGFVPLIDQHELELFSLDADQMRRAAPRVEALRGPIAYLSLRGIKDIVLRSTGSPMPLHHVQFGPCAAPRLATRTPTDGAVHMLCAPVGDPLALAMRDLGSTPSAHASVLSHNMRGVDFSFILTSDI